ncbi:MAG: hypothetical protein ABIJ96_05195 [Elusimicrobiota bacterium]
MILIDILLNWVHVICIVIFMGAMFFATFLMMPALKANLEYEDRHRLVVNLIPKIRRVVRVVVALLVLSGVSRALLLHFTHSGPPGLPRLALFGLKMCFAALPIVIFILAPRILGKNSKEKLCCDPDAEGSCCGPAPKADSPYAGVLSNTGELLHYTAIAGGWLAILCGISLGKIS